MTAASRRAMIDCQAPENRHAPLPQSGCDNFKEIAATMVGAAAGMTLAGAPLVAIGAAAVAAPLVYEGIKAISRKSRAAD